MLTSFIMPLITKESDLLCAHLLTLIGTYENEFQKVRVVQSTIEILDSIINQE